jgi:hypothetical protein
VSVDIDMIRWTIGHLYFIVNGRLGDDIVLTKRDVLDLIAGSVDRIEYEFSAAKHLEKLRNERTES